VPWVLARQIAVAGQDREARRAAVSFASVLNIGAGLVAGAVSAAIATGFADRSGALAVGLGAFLIFLSTNVVGWLQGEERWSLLATLRAGEVVVKTLAGCVFVTLSATATWGLLGFSAGAALLVGSGLVLMRADLRMRFGGLRSSSLWRAAGGISLVQGMVAVLTSLDVVIVASLPAAPDAAGSYQATMIIARIPLFLSTAASLAVFPLLARGRGEGVFVSASLRMYALLAVPLLIALLTAPHAVIDKVFPPDYDQVADFLPWLAISGFSIGVVNLLTTFFQATSRYGRSAVRQAGGLVVTAAGITIGWHADGLRGVAAGAMTGALVSAALLAVQARRTWGGAVSVPARFLAPAVPFAVVLVVLRPMPYLWLAVAIAAGLACCYLAFFRKGQLGDQ
jgi:O-antigen/teichoic acid export membrane protein